MHLPVGKTSFGFLIEEILLGFRAAITGPGFIVLLLISYCLTAEYYNTCGNVNVWMLWLIIKNLQWKKKLSCIK